MENSMDSADFIIGVTINSGIAFVRLLPADITITAQTYRQQAGRGRVKQTSGRVVGREQGI